MMKSEVDKLIKVLNDNDLAFRTSQMQSGRYYFSHPAKQKTLTIQIGDGFSGLGDNFETNNIAIFDAFKNDEQNKAYELNENMILIPFESQPE
ncbi:hypothetical protein ACT3S9_18545 [Pseudoalteromonas sp. AOP31-A2-14]|uniref:hypothetical protein n=1 Tax=Pseudoalteromonas TaxID=53246 RepID=UPI003F98B461